MIIGPRRLALIVAIAAVALMIIFYPIIVATPFDPNDVSLDLSSVSLASGSGAVQSLDLRICLNVTNGSEYTLTTSKIEYALFADGQSVGSDTISYEDIPVNGRPALFTNSPITICDTFTFDYSDARADLFNRILNNNEEISWRITGMAIIESGTTFQERQFSSEL
ncbi:MAG TPA: hypothetical protein VNI77_08965 [Nitrososphaera sp.]|nr:hypothetical protein [Nitrososphaera sp.]